MTPPPPPPPLSIRWNHQRLTLILTVLPLLRGDNLRRECISGILLAFSTWHPRIRFCCIHVLYSIAHVSLPLTLSLSVSLSLACNNDITQTSRWVWVLWHYTPVDLKHLCTQRISIICSSVLLWDSSFGDYGTADASFTWRVNKILMTCFSL